MRENIFYKVDVGFPSCVIQGFNVPRQNGSDIECYICSDLVEISAKNMVILLDGSGGRSVFTVKMDGDKRYVSAPFLFYNLKKYVSEWNIVVFQKYGVKFNDTGEATRSNSEFVENYNRGQRIADADNIIEYLYE